MTGRAALAALFLSPAPVAAEVPLSAQFAECAGLWTAAGVVGERRGEPRARLVVIAQGASAFTLEAEREARAEGAGDPARTVARLRDAATERWTPLIDDILSMREVHDWIAACIDMGRARGLSVGGG